MMIRQILNGEMGTQIVGLKITGEVTGVKRIVQAMFRYVAIKWQNRGTRKTALSRRGDIV